MFETIISWMETMNDIISLGCMLYIVLCLVISADKVPRPNEYVMLCFMLFALNS